MFKLWDLVKVHDLFMPYLEQCYYLSAEPLHKWHIVHKHKHFKV